MNRETRLCEEDSGLERAQFRFNVVFGRACEP